ncbi:hypothetical protein AB1Y20_003512 [Prymnesium parvum]|uniref:Uncharacterized protein n=1 Tax=Prymnesium parvum TaxID=97485 RepID=A0AB34J7A2_PRYPA
MLTPLCFLCFLSSAFAAGPISYLKPGMSDFKQGHAEILRQMEEMRQADAQAKAGPTPPPLAAPPRLALRRLVQHARLPLGVGAAGYALLRGVKAAAARARAAEEKARGAEAARQLDEAAGALHRLVGGEAMGALQQLLAARRADEPAAAASLAAELRARAAEVEALLPLYRQLSLAPPATLAATDAAELGRLKRAMLERCEASSALLASYEALGQSPPPYFRTWSVASLREREANVTAKSEVLRGILRLDAQLGRTKMDWELPAWEEERLLAYSEELRGKVEAHKGHKEKQTLLGKVEAALWLRREEAPIALQTMTVEQLQKLLAKLSGTPSESSNPPASTSDGESTEQDGHKPDARKD